jgi:hypothetical protein
MDEKFTLQILKIQCERAQNGIRWLRIKTGGGGL